MVQFTPVLLQLEETTPSGLQGIDGGRGIHFQIKKMDTLFNSDRTYLLCVNTNMLRFTARYAIQQFHTIHGLTYGSIGG